MKQIKNTWKKIAGACLGIAILISGMGALSACGISGSSTSLRYQLNEDKKSYSVKGIGTSVLYGTPSAKKITIPSSCFGKPVTGIAEWAFEYYRDLESITIPDSVTTIGEGAFYDCRSLKSITLPASLSEFGNRVFMSCNSLTELKLSTDCAAFTCEDSVLYTKDKSQLVCYPPAKTGAFAVPNGVTEIGNMAFLGSVVTTVTLADSVKKVGDEAFEGAALEEITFGSGLSEIGEYAFNITQLKSVNIGAGVTTIGEGAFCQTKSLSAIEVAEDNPAYRAIDGNLYTKDGGILLQYSAGKEDDSFVLPSGTATIEKFAFVGVECLTDVDLSGVKELKYAAFLECKALKNVNLGDRLTTIGDSAFSRCAVESLTIPASVTYMGSNICGGSLSSVTFEKTEGWTVEKKIGYDEPTALSSALLSSPTQACTALQETYRSYIWKNET